MRRPVRTITLPVDLLAQDAVRRADVVARPPGVIVAAFRPKPVSHMAAAASVTQALRGRAAVPEREVVALELDVDAEHRRVEHPQRLLEQLLAGLVAFEHDHPQAHAAASAP